MEIEDRMIEAERNLRLAQSKVESLKEQLDRLEVLEARGAISPMEVSRLRYALDAAQAERKLAALEWDVLEKLR
jgi:outer membrane protein TolC